jgi:hypothetical protein
LVGVHREDDKRETQTSLDIDCEEASIEVHVHVPAKIKKQRFKLQVARLVTAVTAGAAVHQDRRRVLAPPSWASALATSASRTATKET